MRDINKVLAEMRKQHGDAIIRTGNEIPALTVFPTKIPMIDYRMGGGLLMGRTTIVAGVENSGKTSFAYKCAANFQEVEIPVFYVDTEKQYDPERAKLFGVDNDNIYVIQGELTAENVYETVRDLLKSINSQKDTRAFIVVDSIANMVSEALFDKVASTQFGGSARMINQSLQIWQILLQSNQAILAINQFRDNIGSMGEKEMMPGGMGQKYTAATIIWLRAGLTLKEGDVPIGQEIKITIKKSKTSSPKSTAVLKFYYERGFEIIENLVETALEMEVLNQRGGGYYALPSGEEVKGKDKFIKKLQEDTEFMSKLWDLVYSKMNFPLWNGENVSHETIDE